MVVIIVGRGTHEMPVVEGVTHARPTACPWLSARDPRYGSSTLACCGRQKTAYNRPVALGNEGSSAHTKLTLLLTRRNGASPWVGTLAASTCIGRKSGSHGRSLPSPLSRYQPVGEDPSITEIPE